MFDLIAAENGALLYYPSTGEEKLLGEQASGELRADASTLRGGSSFGWPLRCCNRETLRSRGCQGDRELGLDLQVIFNRESVMVLPAGVDKGTGFRAAMAELRLPAASVIGIGDAENDYAFLSLCGFSVAVANAIPSLKERVHAVTLVRMEQE